MIDCGMGVRHLYFKSLGSPTAQLMVILYTKKVSPFNSTKQNVVKQFLLKLDT